MNRKPRKLRNPGIRKKKTLRMFPFVLCLLLLAACAEVVAFFPARPFFEPLTQKVFSWLQRRAAPKGIRMRTLHCKDIEWRFPDEIAWQYVSFRVHSAAKGPFLGEVDGDFTAQEIRVRLAGLAWGKVHMTASGVSFISVPDPDPESRFEFFADHCLIRFHVAWWPFDLVRSRIRRLFNEAYALLKEGKTSVSVQLSGRIRFRIFGKQEEGRVWTVREGKKYRLVMAPRDIQRIAGPYVEQVSDLVCRVLARYPLRIPKALRITDDARAAAQKAFQQDPRIPEDAFRHVLWSFHLTQAFGPQFAKELTDAHEAGEPVSGETDRTEADHIMDIRNNRVGIGYALAGYPETSILSRMMTDPRVCKNVSEVRIKMMLENESQPGGNVPASSRAAEAPEKK